MDASTAKDPFKIRRKIATSKGEASYYDLTHLEKTFPNLRKLPYSVRILLEALVRKCDGRLVTEDDVKRLADWTPSNAGDAEFGFMPARVLLQDFTGVPCVADLAAMRDAVADDGGDPTKINPRIPVDLVIDHSVQVDAAGTEEAYEQNIKLEFERNAERYSFLRWGQQAFSNLRVVPPGTGIVHQVNLEYLASVVVARQQDGELQAFPDSVVGTDSHTTMINGLGVLGWGVGGIEAEAAMLGQPIAMTAPQVVGVALEGALREGVTATDAVLHLTQVLRKHGVVEKFVEFHGPGLDALSLADRATIANMAPEYGATVGFFPVDEETLRYLRQTGRDAATVDLTERYLKAQGLFRDENSPTPEFSENVIVDLSEVEPALAGPKRPQDRVRLGDMKQFFLGGLTEPVAASKGYGLDPVAAATEAEVTVNGEQYVLRHGALLIAAITSCTNTSNPSVMLAAGLLAKRAAERGLKVPAYVKTSLAPGSRAVSSYLREAGLLVDLEQLGFNLVGYGCTTCIGNSGPINAAVAEAVEKSGLVAAAVLSGNRNFEGRVHPVTRANYLASPPLVVAYALAGRVDIDFENEPLGADAEGNPVFLRDVWPSSHEVSAAVSSAITPALFREQYADVFTGGEEWQSVESPEGDRYAWDENSTYIRRPPFFAEGAIAPSDILGARVLAKFGDSVTTDHISPAGNISVKSPAAAYLRERGVEPRDFNSYGARRGNHEVMMRGTFANTRLKNLLVPGTEGNVTIHFPDGAQSSIFEAAEKYAAQNVPLVVLAGKDYGMGSSRDWAAKGVRLLGVRAALCESLERIHRSNLVGMGVLPLQFLPGESAASHGLIGSEKFTIEGVAKIAPGATLGVTAVADDGTEKTFEMRCRLDSPVEVEYFRAGGIMNYVLGEMRR